MPQIFYVKQAKQFLRVFQNKIIMNKKSRCLMSSCPANIYLFKVNNRNTRKGYETCSKFTIKPTEQLQWLRSGVFIVNFEHISQLFFTVSIVDFEHENVSCVVPYLIHNRCS